MRHFRNPRCRTNDLGVVRAQLAMEVDGPYHFTHNTQQPMGHTLIRCAHSGSDDHGIENIAPAELIRGSYVPSCNPCAGF